MNYPTLRTAFILLTTISVSSGQVDDILANAGAYKPRITISDTYSEKVVTETDDGYVFRSVEPNPERIAITIVANLEGAETGALDADTSVGISAGYFDHTALLGDAPDYVPGGKRATFPLLKEMEKANGEAYNVTIGSVLYAWTEKKLTVTVACSDIVAAGVNDIAASDYIGIADAGTTVLFSGDVIDAVVNFGDANGTRRIFLKGQSRTVTRGYGSVAADTFEELDVIDVNVKGESDVDGPSVKALFSAKPSAGRTIEIAGTARDEYSLAKLDAITVNGIETIPAGLGSEEGADGLLNWSVAGLPLVKGKNVVAVSFSDEDGNVTRVTKTYVPDGVDPKVKAFFPLKPSAANTIDIIGTADDTSIVTLDSIQVNGVPMTPASVGAGDSNVTVWNWSIGGLQLAKGRNAILLTFSDAEGNLTKVTKTYTIK